jgi:hypothetical protein
MRLHDPTEPDVATVCGACRIVAARDGLGHWIGRHVPFEAYPLGDGMLAGWSTEIRWHQATALLAIAPLGADYLAEVRGEVRDVPTARQAAETVLRIHGAQ